MDGCAFTSKTYPGAVHDFSIFKDRCSDYSSFLFKTPAEFTMPDPLPEQLSWALMADKGYVDGESNLSAE